MATTNTASVQALDDGEYPFSNTEARRLLLAGLDKVQEEKGLSQRQVAKQLNYKASVVVSHMATGRAPIPVDRAMDIARLLGLEPAQFLLAVLEQRHPDIDFRRILSSYSPKGGAAKGGSESFLVQELESIAGCKMDEMPVATVNVLRDVVADRNAARRWLHVSEIPFIEELRKARPDGLSPKDFKKIKDFLESL